MNDLYKMFRTILLYIDKVEVNDDICGGEPVFRGTRISVQHVGALILRGVPLKDMKEDFPTLNEDDFNFAINFVLNGEKNTK